MPSESPHIIDNERERRNLVNRLRRLAGQIRGVQGMIRDGKDCEAVLTQVMAARSALSQVGVQVIGHAMRSCLSTEGSSGHDALIADAFDVFMRYRSLAAAAAPRGLTLPETPAEMIGCLGELESRLAEVEALVVSDGQCDRLVADIGIAGAVLNRVALGVLGHSMKECLLPADADRDEIIERAVATFLRYSACLD